MNTPPPRVVFRSEWWQDWPWRWRRNRRTQRLARVVVADAWNNPEVQERIRREAARLTAEGPGRHSL